MYGTYSNVLGTGLHAPTRAFSIKCPEARKLLSRLMGKLSGIAELLKRRDWQARGSSCRRNNRFGLGNVASSMRWISLSVIICFVEALFNCCQVIQDLLIAWVFDSLTQHFNFWWPNDQRIQQTSSSLYISQRQSVSFNSTSAQPSRGVLYCSAKAGVSMKVSRWAWFPDGHHRSQQMALDCRVPA